MNCRRWGWGFQIGRLHVTWWDRWKRRPCFEIAWDPA